ncbi:MAG: ligase-associated DNA damage response endonuclease PdeM [Cytophagaceae bacterium]
MKSKKVKFQDQHLLLLPCKAVIWEEQNILILADVHLGKAAHFRKEGINLLSDAALKDIGLLKELLDSICPDKLLILGDLFHSKENSEWKLFEKLVNSCNTEIILVSGNHDILPDEKYQKAGVSVMDKLSIAPFVFTHEPVEIKGSYMNIAGHIHPGTHIKTGPGHSLKLPCFFITEKNLILPAFGSLTGLCMMKKQKGDRLFIITGTEVLEINQKE